jgi:SAM-dependent methyltransferase
VAHDSQHSGEFSILGRVHRRAVFGRRVRVLAELLAAKIPADASVLDIGCGDGSIANLVTKFNPSVTVQGIEFAPRGTCLIDCKAFDGSSIPYAAGSFDVCMFVDVLHHVKDSRGIEKLLSEACRVSRRYVLIKDHLSENRFDFLTLQFMDWVGNRPHGVVLPYNYQSRVEWEKHFLATGLKLKEWDTNIPLYPFPFSVLFGRELHYIGLLTKDSDMGNPVAQ